MNATSPTATATRRGKRQAHGITAAELTRRRTAAVRRLAEVESVLTSDALSDAARASLLRERRALLERLTGGNA
jgi:hypothetical protein